VSAELIVALVGLAIAAALLVDVDLPMGGQVPLGSSPLIAMVTLVDSRHAALALAMVVAVLLPFRATAAAARRTLVLATAAGGAAAIGATYGVRLLTTAHDPTSPAVVLLHVTVAGAAFLAADSWFGRRTLRQVAPLYLTLLSAAALLAIAYRQSPALALVAAVPLLVTKYSFGRFTDIRRTYAQTTQALSLLPEVAGLTPLGHGERTAVYAAALAAELGFDDTAVDRIATAARLHHLGHISLHEPEERTGPVDADELRRVSGDLLRETGFLHDLAVLVEQAQPGGDVAATPLEAAVIRVCSTLDDLAENVVGATGDPFAAVLAAHPNGTERTAAIALLRLYDARPRLLDDARAASRQLALVASGHGHDDEHGHGHDDHEPHDCR
jgi:hypothetical protein